MAEHAHLVRIYKMKPKAGEREQVESLLVELRELANGVEGCFGAQVCRIKEDPDAVGTVSRWDNEEAYAKLRANEDYRRITNELVGMLAEPARAESYISV